MRGFTLIEVVIVAAIVSILALVAIPSYKEQVRKARRADAAGVLLQNEQFLGRFFTENRRFDQDRNGNAVALPHAKSPIDGAEIIYNVNLQAVAANTFTLQAIPVGSQAVDVCGTLTLNQAGRKGNDPPATVDECW